MRREPEPENDDEPPEEQDGQSDPTPEPKPVKLPDWLEAVWSYLEDVTQSKGPYHSQGSLRDALKSELDIQKRTYPLDRSIERMLSKYCQKWFIKEGS